MDSDKTGQAPEGAKDGKENISADQYHALQDKLEKVIAAQSGSDKKVAELLTQLETKEKEKQTISAEKLSLSEQVKLINEKLERAEAEKNHERQKALALTLTTGMNIPQEVILPYIGATDQETTERINGFLAWYKTDRETVSKETANKILSKGPTPGSGDSDANNKSLALTMDKYTKMTKDDLRKYQKENPAGWQEFVKGFPVEPGTTN